MESACKLCKGDFDFRAVQITEVLGSTGIYFTAYRNHVEESTRFRFCPLCGRELTNSDFEKK